MPALRDCVPIGHSWDGMPIASLLSQKALSKVTDQRGSLLRRGGRNMKGERKG